MVLTSPPTPSPFGEGAFIFDLNKVKNKRK